LFTVDRIGRIETILSSLVEQAKTGSLTSPAGLNEIAQDVKQLHAAPSESDPEDSPEHSELSHGISEGFSASGLRTINAVPATSKDRPASAPRRYTTTGINANARSESVPGETFQPPQFGGEQNLAPREHQRRRLHPPAQTVSSQSADMDENSDIEDGDEIVQLAGQLSLDENKTVRYHGSSSGLTLLTRSKRFDGTFWNLPNPGLSSHILLTTGFWPTSDRRTVKTELEIDSKTQLPPISVQDRLLQYFHLSLLMIGYTGNTSILMSPCFTKTIFSGN
jgi:hypothetical protein